uniref:Uncharacterized protein n=1 Tax=Panagrolaimus sp. ES5 TaxID=591445 RepID=A0AC34G0F3_9BILA
MAEEPAAAAATTAAAKNDNDNVSKPNIHQQQKPRRPRYPKKDKIVKVKSVDGEEEDTGFKKDLQVSNKKCKYFKATGKCRFGDKCRFRHVVKEAKDEDNEEALQPVEKPMMHPEQTIHMPSNPSTRRFIPSKPVKILLKSDQTGSEEQKKAREVDILYFKRRFPKTLVKSLEDDKTVITFVYTVSNPEWVFDVNTVTFILSLDPEHPISCATVDIAQGMMPSPLHIYLIKKFNDILREKHNSCITSDSFEPIGKWFVREIDKNILELFIVGLKRTKWLQDAHASGLKVTVFDTSEEKEQKERELTKPETLQKIEEKENKSEESESENEGNLSSEEKPKQIDEASNSVDANIPKSAQLKVAVNWVDSEQSIGTITFSSISGAARCLRCATQEFFDVANGKEHSWNCKKCSTVQSIKFESVLGHQNSNIFGHVYPKGCRPVDCILLSSKLKIACMNCSKDFTVEALPYGSPSLTWCRQCNAKIRFAVDSIQFQGQFNAIPEGEKGAASKGPKKKNLKDDIMLTPGQPLPKKGTCKHYGKSFRWFRFPCCGKLYPCDECHAANERDHEMKVANRMVCGLCSTEQPFSKESCKHCKGNVINIKSQFWEGGKGCRNQIALSKLK